MSCTTLLSMWLSNTSTTAMVMPIVEAVLKELVGAEDEQLVACDSSAEEAEPTGTVCRTHSSWAPLPPPVHPPSSGPHLLLPPPHPTPPHTRPCSLKLP